MAQKISLTGIASILLFAALAIVAAVRLARGSDRQSFEGVIVQNFGVFAFYPGISDCHVTGTPYVIIPDSDFYNWVHTSASTIESYKLFHGTWRAKLNGNLSRIGVYRYDRTYWRQLSVNYVIDARELSCR